MNTPAVAILTAGMIALSACSAAPSSTSTTSAAPASSVVAPSAGDAQALLERNGLTGLSAQQIVERLDASQEDRTAGPMGSVRPDALVLSDAKGEARMPLPADSFYLAFAPYRTRTHDCFNHNLATCQGELASTTLTVKIVTDDGKTLVDGPVRTHANGFAGVWLPSNIEATLSVSVDGESVTAPIATGPQDPTCVTTLQLA